MFDRSFEILRDGFVSPHRLTYLPGKISGCVYRSDGSKVALSERFGGFMGDHAQNDNPEHVEPPTNAKRLAGRGLYLGHYMGGHYGHFITEGLSTFWIFAQHPAKTFDYFVFHPFSFGTDIPDYVRFCLERFGIAEDRIVFVGAEPLRVSEVVVPERLFRLNHSADVQSRWTYQHIAAATVASGASAPSRIYLSRRRFSRRQFERVVANEVQIEAVFRAHGFQILYPETLSFQEQVRLYSHADVVAGISGSGLHNSVFMRPDTDLIELGDPRYKGLPAPTQALCDQIAGVRNHFIPFAGHRFGPKGTMLFDISFLEASLSEALGPPGSESQARRPSLAHVAEIAYLSARPTAGYWARRAFGKSRATA